MFPSTWSLLPVVSFSGGFRRASPYEPGRDGSKFMYRVHQEAVGIRIGAGMNAKNVVLVHGAWADGSCWSDVIRQLQEKGYNVTAPQFPHTSLADNLARLRQVLAVQTGPTIVAGHSYGGQVITALGNDAPNVVGLVYIAAFGLDEGESLGALLAQGPPTPALAHLRVDAQGFAWIPREDFVKFFAADVDPVKANVMYAVQQPLAMSTIGDVMGAPAWKTLPSWFMVATNDQAIPPDVERLFARRMKATVEEIESSHVAMVSYPDAVADLIVRAAGPAARQELQGIPRSG